MANPVKPLPEVSLFRQQARCAFTAIAFGHAILELPEEIPVEIGRKKMENLCDRVTRWHGQACRELGENRLPPLNGKAVTGMIRKFRRLAYPAGYQKKRLFHAVKGFWACVVFLWDVRITCPDVARNNTWRYLDKATDELGRILLKCEREAEVPAEDLYLELVW